MLRAMPPLKDRMAEVEDARTSQWVQPEVKITLASLTQLQQWPLDIFINTANILILDKGWEENFRKCGQTKHDPFLAQDPGKKKPSFKKTNLEDEEIHWQ